MRSPCAASTVDFVDGAATPRTLLAGADVHATVRAGEPIAVAIRGDVHGRVPCDVSFRGGALMRSTARGRS